MQEMYRSDGLRHNRISAPLFFGMVEGGEMLLRARGEIRMPVLLLVGGEDPIICPRSTREFYDRLASEDKTLLLYPRMLHEPFNELGREQVFDDLAGWLAPAHRQRPDGSGPIATEREYPVLKYCVTFRKAGFRRSRWL